MTTHLPFQPLNAPGVRYDTQIFLLVIFITERTSLCFITFCNTYDIQTFGSLILIGIPAVFYPKLAFSKQHALRNGHACFQAMISFDNKWSFCCAFYLFFKTVVCCICFLYLLPSCGHICMYYRVEFIQVSDMLHRAWGVVFLGLLCIIF